MKRPSRLVPATLLLAGTLLLGAAAWLPLKALLAQQLLERAWAAQRAGDSAARPWPWADTFPLARLRQPALGVDQIVLQGASGRTLAFGPGHVSVSMAPGRAGNVVIAGHRDTHFRWLRHLRPGDPLVLEARDGSQRRYRVAVTRVQHESATALVDPLAADRLQLVTCYPFDALDPGTPLRYVVTARPVAG